MSNDSVLISKEEWLKKNDFNSIPPIEFICLWREYERQVERMLQFTSAVAASPVEAKQIIDLLNNPLHTVTPAHATSQKVPALSLEGKLNRAIELLEACSEDMFLGFGDDVELEHRVDEFIKEVKS